MRHLVQSWINGITRKLKPEEGLAPRPQMPIEIPATETLAVPTSVSGFAPAEVIHLRETPVEPVPALAELPAQPAEVAADLALITRGSKLYGICPHCEATWNIKERMSHPSFKRLEYLKGLTCPACSKPVALPRTADLRKLS